MARIKRIKNSIKRFKGKVGVDLRKNYNRMISIIIPIYNVEKYIIDCLKSVEKQKYTNYEVILVDDCGTDSSMQLVNSFLQSSSLKGKTQILHHTKNRGLSAARNTGTAVAKGDYIYYLDSDDTIEADCLEKLVKKAEETGAQMVVGDINVVGDGEYIPVVNILGADEIIAGREDNFHRYLKGEYYMMAWNKLVRRDFLEKNNITFVEGLIHEDCAWSFSMACALESVAFVQDKTYNYLVRSNSIQTDKNFTKHFNAYCSLLRYYADQAHSYSLTEDNFFVSWYEKQKALHFSQTMRNGSKEQLSEIYSIIKKNLPHGRWTKDDCHYLFPKALGLPLYKKFHGYKLM